MKSRYAEVTRDANEDELVKVAKQLGAQWWQAPPFDGWVLHRGVWLGPTEIKMPEREGLAHEYTPQQKRFIAWAKANNAPHLTWRTAADVIERLGGRVSA